MRDIDQTFKLERFISPYHVPGVYDGQDQGSEVVVDGELEVVVEGVVATGEGDVVATGDGEIEGAIKELLGNTLDINDDVPKVIGRDQDAWGLAQEDHG